ncbi:hypothetical protein DYBT9275_05725 [Dyadobacter sp. CECT 9275]|uniref:Cytochrome c domain-containing protein n=1 Tax=Dyadobacter helix TaxID=2822344 RepID=A0A916JJM7_9BACT|nr:PQQ-dependent sugar dehydrogenase [Dyadobacter sp. CECT 9275]CAG5017213.1 hypothetical protein DYBT9275_05725 [Dyadobacter sp. CECT 9275]
MFYKIILPFCGLLSAFVLTPCAVAGQQASEYPTDTKTIAQGKELFNNTCSACHTLADDGIGPRLGGVTAALSKTALVAFVQDPSKVISSGDKRAVNLHKKYKQLMPGFNFLKSAEIISILAYIDVESRAAGIKPLVVNEVTEATAPPVRLIAPVAKPDLRIELEDFIQLPATSEKPPLTRIATMRPFPAHDGTLFVSDQRGIIYRIKDRQYTTFLDLREKVASFINVTGLGTGLGSFAFHPEYLSNGLIYITHTETFKGQKADYEYADSIRVKLQWVLSEWKMNDVHSPTFEGTRRELLRINVPGDVHGVQDIGFEPGISKGEANYGKLFMGTGDGGATIGKHPELAHNLRSFLGTIIRIDPLGNNSPNGQYGIPADNPFVKNPYPGIRKEIWAYGFRNPHRLAWDKVNGKSVMFEAEVGESNFEEINIIQKGKDYGWNVREGAFGILHSDLKNVYKIKPSEEGNFQAPFAAYDHVDGNAISGGYVYHGNIKALKNKYVFGDIVNGRLFYLNINKEMSDHTIHEMIVMQNGKSSDLREISGSKRVDLRILYNDFTGDMFVMTKSDGKIRKIKTAYAVRQQ